MKILIFNCKFSSYFSPLLTIYIPVSMLPNCCKMTINYKNTRREMEKSLKNHPHIIVDTIIIIIITFLMQNSGVAELCMKSKVPSGCFSYAWSWPRHWWWPRSTSWDPVRIVSSKDAAAEYIVCFENKNDLAPDMYGPNVQNVTIWWATRF